MNLEIGICNILNSLFVVVALLLALGQTCFV